MKTSTGLKAGKHYPAVSLAVFSRAFLKLHAGTLHHENAQMQVHEVFVHHFRLPRRGRGNGTFLIFAMLLHSKMPTPPRWGGLSIN